MLVESGAGTREDVRAAAEEAQGLGLFIRSLVGLDRSAVQASFNEFLSDVKFSSAQQRFIDQVISYLTANGSMSADALYESPLSDDGVPDDVLGGECVDVVVDIREEFRRRAMPEEPPHDVGPQDSGDTEDRPAV